MSEIMVKMKEVEDVLGAVNIALNYLSQKGIVVFTREVRSAFKNSRVWIVEIDGDTFAGIIVVRAKTGEVINELAF